MSNRLGDETSPYLRQHADNPVQWWPWCAEALSEARARDRPILLSIGYSACHWCHVMAHECFEDDAIAALMNRDFINIKVDREERPDLDRIYQLAHNALTGRGGGWPLTVFLTPGDLLPFFAGTYFPPAPRHGMPGFAQVLEGIARYHRERYDEIDAQNRRLQAFLDDAATGAPMAGEPTAAPLTIALETLARAFDPVHGGHRGGPKFPHAAELRLWLSALATPCDGVERGAIASHAQAERIVLTTLDAMADRGLYDHLGGGFFRYCVDDAWTIPHFEKMLYDNAQLLPVYAEAALALNDRRWLATIAGTLDFLERELRSEHSAFFCALDADSPGGEGAYYVWTRAQVDALLPADQAAAFSATYGLDREPNFEGEAWHLLRQSDPFSSDPGSDGRISSSAGPGLEPAWDEAQSMLAQARTTLLAERARRPAPGLDDKVLTSWNALTIAGLARCTRALLAIGGRDPDQAAANQAALELADRAQRLADAALDRIHRTAWRNGRLFADDRGRFPGYLDDYAFLLDALLEQLQQRWSARDADWARALADALIEHFEDRAGGGFWFTAHDHETLPQRPKPWTDDATPSGNAIAARALLALGHLYGETRWLDVAERALRAGGATLASHPHAAATLLLALDEWLAPTTQIVVRGRDETALTPWRTALSARAGGRVRIFLVPDSEAPLPSALAAMSAHGSVAAYACRGSSCAAPSSSVERLLASIT